MVDTCIQNLESIQAVNYPECNAEIMMPIVYFGRWSIMKKTSNNNENGWNEST